MFDVRSLALGAALLAAPPAAAVVFPQAASPAEDFRRAQGSIEAGARFSSVVRIIVPAAPDDEDRPGPLGGKARLATGVYIGGGAEGRGFVLTCAHLFRLDQAPVRPAIAFGPGPDLGDLVPAAGIYLHPSRKKAFPEGTGGLSLVGADLALVTFDPSQAAEAMARAHAVPAVPAAMPLAALAGGFWGDMVGFGELRIEGQAEPRAQFLAHAARFRVKPGAIGDPGGPGLLFSARTEAAEANPCKFLKAAAEDGPAEPDLGRDPVLEGACSIAWGDSGGPLFLEGPDGKVVAGIACGRYLCRCAPGASHVHVSFWAPVGEHHAWIRGIQEGTPGVDAWVDGPGAWERRAPRRAPCSGCAVQ